MRPFEIILVTADVVAFAVLMLPLPGAPRWPRHLALVPLVATGVQMLVEGRRWQMIPAYALAVIWSVVWLRRRVGPAGPRRRPSRIAAAAGVAPALVGTVLSVALPTVFPVVEFARPTGRFDVGTLTYHWVDTARPEAFTADPDDRREVMVQVWYPADADRSAPRAAYLPDADAVTPTLARIAKLPAFSLRHLRYVTTNAIASAPVADGQRRYPVLLMMIGQGGYRQVYTFQAEELVSHGYIVAAIEQPYAHATVVFPDGRQVAYDDRMQDDAFMRPLIPHLARDATLTIDRLTEVDRADPNGVLTGRLDLRRAGLVGQSLGGIVGAQACLREPRLRACLLEDAFMPRDVVREGLQQPAMWITRDAGTMRLERRRAGGWSEADIDEHLTTMRAVFDRLPGDGYYVEVPGMFHLDMTDAALLSPLASQLGLAGPIGPRRVHRIINAYTLAFFDRHLRGRPAPLLDGASERFPEVRIESRAL